MNTNLLDRLPAETRATPSPVLPRLLVVTYFSPAARHGGAVCVQNLLDGYSRERLAWMHHEEPVTDPASPWSSITQWPIGLLQRPNRFGLRPLKEYGNWTLHAPRMARRAADLAAASGIEAVLGIGPGISVWTSHLIARRLRVPLHLWIHDDPEAYATWRGEYGTLLTRIRQCFMRAYQAAAVRYAISEPMREYYHKLTGCDAVVLPPSLGPRDADVSPAGPCATAVSAAGPAKPAALGSVHPRRLRIGVAGSMAGPEVWEAFTLALERLFDAARLPREPEIVVFAEPDGVPVPPSVAARGWVKVRDWQPVETVDRELATMDYLYIPLWFSDDRRIHARTSFSTKFVSYLRAGVPILCHVPDYSAVAGFVRRCPVGPVLDTVDVSMLADQLRDVFDSEDWHARYAAARPEALAEFNHTTLLRRFHRHLRTGAECRKPRTET